MIQCAISDKSLLDLIGEVATVDDALVGQRQLIRRTLGGLHTLLEPNETSYI